MLRVADYFYSINSHTLIDEELTDFLSSLSQRFYFTKENYNLSNRLLYDEAEDMLNYHKPFVTKMGHYVERYNYPAYHTKDFVPDFSLEECMDKLLEIDEEKRQKRGMK